MSKQKPSVSTHIEGNNEGDIIQGKGNILDKSTYNINNSPDTDEISDAIYSANYRTRWDESRGEFLDSESRKIKETMFVSAVSGALIGVLWDYIYPLTPLISFSIVLLTLITITVLRITHFGVRHIFVSSVLISLAYYFTIKYFPSIINWITINPVVGVLLFAMYGAIIGFVIGIVLMIWRPLDI